MAIFWSWAYSNLIVNTTRSISGRIFSRDFPSAQRRTKARMDHLRFQISRDHHQGHQAIFKAGARISYPLLSSILPLRFNRWEPGNNAVTRLDEAKEACLALCFLHSYGQTPRRRRRWWSWCRFTDVGTELKILCRAHIHNQRLIPLRPGLPNVVTSAALADKNEERTWQLPRLHHARLPDFARRLSATLPG